MTTAPVIRILEDEMHRAGMNKRELAQALSACSAPITEQALGMWWSRGKIPTSRVADLAKALNSSTLLAELAHAIVQPWGGAAPAKADPSPVVRYSARVAPAAVPSAAATLLAEWLDKIDDDMLKLQVFHACTTLIMQALRPPETTGAPASHPQP